MTVKIHAPAVAPTPTMRAVGGVTLAIVVSVFLNMVIAGFAHAFGAAEEFQPLQFPSYTFLTVVGLVAGAIGWALVRRRSHRPAVMLRRLVPTVLVASFVPDVLLLTSNTQPGTSGLAVLALMGMHVVVAVVAVLTFRRIMPLPPHA